MCGETSEPYYEALARCLRPTHYEVEIFDIAESTYAGKVAISLDVVESTDELHLHYRDLNLKSAHVIANGNHEAQIGSFDPKRESFAVKFPHEVAAGTSIVVHVEFAGNLQTNMAGFYKSTYKEDGETKTMLSTQFEATDARRAFPCLDEPLLKATFTVHITAQKDLEVLGNMPVEKVTQKGDLKTVSFQISPKMSTYLLAWAVGEFEYIEAFTTDLFADNKPLPVRIYTTKGYTADAEFALEIAPKVVEYFSRIFELKYPLPKLDLIAVHAFSHNAMENWGLITYRSTALLYSAASSDPSYKQKVAYVVAHEIAHQWFGNLVTMQWWDELWLNEGFATWVGYAAVDHLFPDWHIFLGFVSTAVQTALNLDGLHNSHPIKVPVKDALDIDQLFDAISYLKGASTIRMLLSYLGKELFLKGVALYLKRNEYGNATSEDLWAAILEVSGKPIDSMMQSWITKVGFPVLEAQMKNDNLEISQSRFLNSGHVAPEDDQTTWWVPLGLQSSQASLEEKLLSISGIRNPFKLNSNVNGFFRVNYLPELLHDNILASFGLLSDEDKVGVIADVAVIAASGDSHTNTCTLLSLVKSICIDNDYLGDSYVAWLELTSRLSELRTAFSGRDAVADKLLDEFLRTVYSKLAVRLLAQDVPAESFLLSKLKAHILNTAALYQIPELSKHARELFKAWRSGESIDPVLRKFVLISEVSAPDLSQDDFDFVMSEVTSPKSLDSREVALEALGHVSSEKHAHTLFESFLDESVVPVMDAHFLGSPISKNPKFKLEFWRFFRSNYTTFYRLMSSNMVVLDRFINFTLKHYLSSEVYEEVKTFFASQDVHGFERSLSQVLDRILINAAWVERDDAEVRGWLSKNGYK